LADSLSNFSLAISSDRPGREDREDTRDLGPVRVAEILAIMRTGFARWFPVDGGHKVIFPF
jgi:hypothetical protein